MKILKYVLLFIVVLAMVGCATDDVAGPGQSPSEKWPEEEGYIVEIGEHSVLIVEHVDPIDFGKPWNELMEGEVNPGNAIWLKTEKAAEFEVGQKVRYSVDGPVMESYPMQGTAKEIIVLNEGKVDVGNAAFREVATTVTAGAYMITGEARVYEATMQYAVWNGEAYILEDFVTVSDGAPEWVDFTLEIQIPEEQWPAEGKLSVELFEYSAEDGQRINVIRVPLERFSAEISG